MQVLEVYLIFSGIMLNLLVTGLAVKELSNYTIDRISKNIQRDISNKKANKG